MEICAVTGKGIAVGQLLAQVGGRDRMQRLGVQGAQVIALHEILHQALPIGLPHLLSFEEKMLLRRMVIADVRLGR